MNLSMIALVKIKKFVKPLLVSLFLLLLFVVVVVTAFFKVESARLFLVTSSVELVNEWTDFQVDIVGVSTPSSGEWFVESLLLSKNDESWIAIHDLAVKWQPQYLLERQIFVNKIHVKHIKLHKLSKATSNTSNSSSFKLPELFIDSIYVDSIDTKELDLGLSGGVSEDYKVEGRVELLSHSPILINLKISDVQNINILNIESESESMNSSKIIGRYREAPNGFLSQKFQLPELLGIDAEFDVNIETLDSTYQLIINHIKMPFGTHDISLSGSIRGSMKLSSYEFMDVELLVDGISQQFSGTVNNENLALSLKLTNFPLEIISPFYSIAPSGKISSELTLSGHVSSPNIEGFVRGLIEHQEQLFHINAEGGGGLTSFNFSQFSIKTENENLLAVQATGVLDWTGESSDLTLNVSALDVDLLSAYGIEIPSNLKVKVGSAKGRVYGALLNPEGALTIDADVIYLNRRSKVSADLEKRHKDVTINRLNIVEGESSSAMAGNIDLDTLLADLHVKTDRLPLSLLTLANIKLPKDLTGELTADAQIKGVITLPVIDGSVQLSGFFKTCLFQLTLKAFLIKVRTVYENCRQPRSMRRSCRLKVFIQKMIFLLI